MSLVPVDTMSAVAVSDYLTQCRDWLATCVELTGPDQIAAAKAEIATAAEATKQLGLSKEIQLDAQEMVRRAEYALGKAIRKGQAEGFIAKATDTLRQNRTDQMEERQSPSTFIAEGREHNDISAMTLTTSDEFDDVIDEAKAEGNLSRANVARKAREKAGAPSPRERSLQESELITAFRSMVRPLLAPKNVESLSPKSRALLVDLLERAIQTLKGTDL